MKKIILPIVAALMSGCISITSDGVDDDREDGRDTSVTTVPPKVLSAARARVPGFRLTEAELRDRDGIRIYSLEGKAGDEDYEIDVTPGGRVVSIDN